MISLKVIMIQLVAKYLWSYFFGSLFDFGKEQIEKVQVIQISDNSRRKKVFSLEFNQSIYSVSDMIDSIEGFLLKLLKLQILTLKLSELFELLIELFVVGMENGGLKGQCTASNRKDTDGQYSLEDEHLFCFVNLQLILIIYCSESILNLSSKAPIYLINTDSPTFLRLAQKVMRINSFTHAQAQQCLNFIKIKRQTLVDSMIILMEVKLRFLQDKYKTGHLKEKNKQKKHYFFISQCNSLNILIFFYFKIEANFKKHAFCNFFCDSGSS